MKTVLAILMAMSVTVFAAYDYVIQDGDHFGAISLSNSQTMLVTGGGGDYLNLFDHSQADIQNTSALKQYEGGIWQMIIGGYSNTIIEGGEIHHLDLLSYAQAQLSGGRIDLLSSTQNATYTKHIEIICRDWEYNVTSKILSGIWEDYSAFNIQLVNVAGYSPTFDNIKFTIPEPTSLLLLAAGGLLLRRKVS